MNIKSALESLNPQLKQKIMHHFNNVEPYLVLLEDEHFISVNMEPNKEFSVIEKSEYWLLGRFK